MNRAHPIASTWQNALRRCLTVLLVLALGLVGTGRGLALEGDAAPGRVLIAGTLVVLCQTDGTDAPALAAHHCDLCTHQAAPLLPTPPQVVSVIGRQRPAGLAGTRLVTALPRRERAAALPRGPPDAARTFLSSTAVSS